MEIASKSTASAASGIVLSCVPYEDAASADGAQAVLVWTPTGTIVKSILLHQVEEGSRGSSCQPVKEDFKKSVENGI